MSLRTIPYSIVLALIVVAAAPAKAHHSFAAGYEADKRVTVSGVVTRFDYMSPHSLVRIDVKGADGATQSWLLEFGSPLALSKFGWSATTLKFGDTIQAVGAPAHSGALRIYVFELRRPADGFEYKAESKAESKEAP